jgi:hypothetical protein
MQTFAQFVNQWVGVISSYYIAQDKPAILCFRPIVMPPTQFMCYLCHNNIWNSTSFLNLEQINLTGDYSFNPSPAQYIGRLSNASLLDAVNSIKYNKYWSQSVGLPALPWC